MRALSLWQPWSSLMALGLKHIETRGWNMTYRGRLAIHATATWQPELIRYLKMPRSYGNVGLILDLLAESGVADWRMLPLGAVLCSVEVYDCRPTEELAGELDERELCLGNYRPGRFGIMTRNLQRLLIPAPCKGKQGIWDWKQNDRP